MLAFGILGSCILCVKKQRPSHKFTLQGALLLAFVITTALPVIHGVNRESADRVQGLGGEYYLGAAVTSLSGTAILMVSVLEELHT